MKRVHSSSSESYSDDGSDHSAGGKGECSNAANLTGDRSYSSIRYALRDALEHFAPATRFASSGACPTEVNPGLYINGLGTVGLPLSERDAKLITNASHPAPYGKGSETVVDTAVRRTWELNADDFELRNPQWPGALKAVLDRVVKELDLADKAAAVEAHLHKLLLYEEGSMFKAHRDSEKEPGMFGTLVICLPSKYEGGQVVVTHGGSQSILTTADTSEFGTSYLCWYADVQHEVQPVTAGFRLALTYNLVNTSSSASNTVPVELDEQKRKIDHALARWRSWALKSPKDCPLSMVCLLEHLYTKESLAFKSLKGNDRLIGPCLSEICSKYGFKFCLAEVNHSINGECESYCDDWEQMYWNAREDREPDIHDIFEVQETRLGMRHLVDIHGNLLMHEVPLDMSQIIQHRPFDGSPDREDFTGPTGNEGVSATHFYHRSAIVLVPDSLWLDFSIKSCTSLGIRVEKWLETMLFQASQDDAEKETRVNLQKACALLLKCATQDQTRFRMVYGWQDRSTFTDELFGTIIRAGISLNDRNLALTALSLVKLRVPQAETAELIHTFGLMQNMDQLNAAVERFRRLLDRLGAHAMINTEYGKLQDRSESVQQAMLAWTKERALLYIPLCGIHEKDDGLRLAEVAILCGQTFLVADMLPVISAQLTHDLPAAYQAMFAFLSHLHSHADWSTEVTKEVFQTLVGNVLPHIELTPAPSKQYRIAQSFYEPSRVRPTDVKDLISQCSHLGLEKTIFGLLDTLTTRARTEDAATSMKNFFLPLVGQLVPMVVQGGDATSQEMLARIKAFMASAIALCAKRCIGPKPARPADWRRPTSGCGCAACMQMDAFLVDASKMTATLSVGTNDLVTHMKAQLPKLQRLDNYYSEEEYDTNVVLSNEPDQGPRAPPELWICKTLKRWECDTAMWTANREAAQKVFREHCQDAQWQQAFEDHLIALEACSVEGPA